MTIKYHQQLLAAYINSIANNIKKLQDNKKNKNNQGRK